MSDETVPIHIVHRLLQSAERRGVDQDPLLREAGISDDVAWNPRARVTLGQLAKVTRAVWEVTGDELFGVGPPVPLGSFRLMARSMVAAPDLREMLVRIDQATRVLTGIPRITVDLADETTTVSFDVTRLDDPEHLATDTLVAFVHRTIGWAIGRRVALTALEFPYVAPPFLAYYESTFGRMPKFDASRASFSFSSVLLDAPLLRADTDIDQFIADSPQNFFSTRDYGSTVGDQVRRILEQGLSGDWPTAEEVAARLSVSADHLRRLLREELTSMTEIREEILRDAAINSLVAGKESVEELSSRLGFSEASAFRRAFRRWTGIPPGAYRAGLADEV